MLFHSFKAFRLHFLFWGRKLSTVVKSNFLPVWQELSVVVVKTAAEAARQQNQVYSLG